MAEILGRVAAENAAGRKALIDSQARTFVAVVEMPAVWTAAQNDTVASGLFLPKGCRLTCPVTVSNNAGTAGQTLSVGLRNATTKVVKDATAIAAAVAINAAQTVQVNSGTKLTDGQRYALEEDSEIFLTLGGAVPAANQRIRVEVSYGPA